MKIQDYEIRMDKENDNDRSTKIDSLIELFKRIKTLVLVVLTLMVFAVAILSGDGVKLFSNFYEKTTGLKHETFSPIEDFSSESYLILRDKLSHNQNMKFEDAFITIYIESETLQKYRVEIDDEIAIYSIGKQANGVWKIEKQ